MKKSWKKILVFLSLCLTIVFSTVSVQAAGVETWYAGYNGWNNFTVTDYNITPVKTIGASGTLLINVGFESARDGVNEPEWYPPVNVRIEVREAYTGRVLAGQTFREEEFFEPVNLWTYNVTQGMQVQLYIDISSQYNPPGPYRKGFVSYEASIW